MGADFPPASQFQLQMLQIMCSDTWAEKDRCCELPALVSGNKILDTVPWPCESATKGYRVWVDGLYRPVLREVKADFLDEVARDLNRKVPQAFGGRPRSLICSYSSCHDCDMCMTFHFCQ